VGGFERVTRVGNICAAAVTQGKKKNEGNGDAFACDTTQPAEVARMF
jgi:hypothetical protein